MTSQLEQWRGEFGAAYTDRNVVDWGSRMDALCRIMPTGVRTVLEVGCNRGHNLRALEMLGYAVAGYEPSTHARRIARRIVPAVYDRSIYDLPLARQWDLAFTCGVLIHIPPERLDEALVGMNHVARRYLLAIEYHADEDTEVVYRGLREMMWKRDYGAHYLRLFPDLQLVATGDLTETDGFAGARFWLLEKPC